MRAAFREAADRQNQLGLSRTRTPGRRRGGRGNWGVSHRGIQRGTRRDTAGNTLNRGVTGGVRSVSGRSAGAAGRFEVVDGRTVSGLCATVSHRIARSRVNSHRKSLSRIVQGDGVPSHAFIFFLFVQVHQRAETITPFKETLARGLRSALWVSPSGGAPPLLGANY